MLRRRGVKDLRGRQVFVTGAASGIGRAIAVAAAAEGAQVHLTDINNEPLQEAAETIRSSGGSVGLVQAADISDHVQVAALAKQLTDTHGSMDVLMNVAGIAEWGTVQATPHDSYRRVIDINLMGPIHVMEELVPPMIEAGRGGQIVNVSSAAGLIALPWHGAYSASKFGLRGISEVFGYDLAPHGIGVTLVCPGAVDTGLTQTVKLAGVDTSKEQRFIKARKRFQQKAVSPEKAAEATLKGVRRGKRIVYTSQDIHLLYLVKRVFPPGYWAFTTVFHNVANRILPAAQGARKELSS